MVMENGRQTNVCKNYAKSHESLDDTKSFKLLSTNSILSSKVRTISGLVAYKLSQRRRHFNVLNLFKPGEILDSVFYKKELI